MFHGRLGEVNRSFARNRVKNMRDAARMAGCLRSATAVALAGCSESSQPNGLARQSLGAPFGSSGKCPRDSSKSDSHSRSVKGRSSSRPPSSPRH